MREPSIELMYLPVTGYPVKDLVYGPGDIRPAWVRLRYRSDARNYETIDFSGVEIQNHPKFLRLRLPHHDNHYRQMFKMVDGETNYYVPTEPTYEEYGQFFDELAPHWQAFEEVHEHEQFSHWILRELQQRQVPQEAKILVIDKGTGMLGRFLMQNWYTNISLLALSPKMADLAKADASYQDKEIMVGTPLNHEFKEKYDVIVASEILQYFVRDSAELWCHLSGALKNPGLLVSSDIYPLPEAEKCFQEVKFSHHDMHIQGQTVRRMAMNVFAGVRSSSS